MRNVRDDYDIQRSGQAVDVGANTWRRRCRDSSVATPRASSRARIKDVRVEI